jgi:hypothetical protein
MLRHALLAVLPLLAAACSTAPAYSRALASIGPEHVREQLGEVRYVSGHAETERQYRGEVRERLVAGMLVATDTALQLLDRRNDGAWLTIPLRTVVTTGDAVENGGPTVAGRVLFGVLATDARDETITVRRELEDTVEVVVFRVAQRGGAPGIAAKIDFHAKRMRGAVAQ